MKIKHIIWDWNGTLLDDCWLCVESINKLLLKRGLPLIDKEKYLDIFCFPVEDYYIKLGFDFEKEGSISHQLKSLIENTLGNNGELIKGKVGKELNVEQGYEAARRTCLRMLTNVKSIIGDLDKITHVVKIFGMVQATADFNQYAQVVNGCSDLLVELYGDAGKHARSSMGVARNPFDGVVSIDGVFEVSG